MNKNEALFEYTLRLGDSALVLGHRLSEWCGHGPILEEDIATTNIALDFVGLGTNLLTYAAQVENKGRTEDDLAFLRNERDFKNVLLAEQPNGDYATTIARQFLYDVYSYHLYAALTENKDQQLAAIAGKAIKEIQYHLRHSTQWMLRLGDGTQESNERLQNGINELWMYTGDLFDMDEVDALLIKEGIAPDLNKIKSLWQKQVDEVLAKANIKKPADEFMQKGSRDGRHTEHLGFMLAEMQYLQRSYPGAKW